MSYDPAEMRNIRSAREWGVVAEEDKARLEFLHSIAAAQQRSADPLAVTPWEAQFIADIISSPRTLTPRQRECVAELRKQYGGRI